MSRFAPRSCVGALDFRSQISDLRFQIGRWTAERSTTNYVGLRSGSRSRDGLKNPPASVVCVLRTLKHEGRTSQRPGRFLADIIAKTFKFILHPSSFPGPPRKARRTHLPNLPRMRRQPNHCHLRGRVKDYHIPTACRSTTIVSARSHVKPPVFH
jgi:hypothetical protein